MKTVYIGADEATAQALNAQAAEGSAPVHVIRPGARVNLYAGTRSSVYSIDYTDSSFDRFVMQVLRPLAPLRVIAASRDAVVPSAAATAALSLACTDRGSTGSGSPVPGCACHLPSALLIAEVKAASGVDLSRVGVNSICGQEES
ncbi:hypothetical protein ABH940_003492 [Streptacidiphilus sp. BW17]|uniref:hypothetical protein n=1 Tax=Streptacidiphilus sp. BW17 TaxID=3156274 RepID=UPI003517127A